MIKKIIVLCLAFVCLVTINTRALTDDLARNIYKLPDTTVNVSEADDGDIWFDMGAVINTVRLIDDNAYYGNLIITNDTSTAVKLTQLAPVGAVPITHTAYGVTYDKADMKVILTDWMYMSFKSDAGNGLSISDNTIDKFDGEVIWGSNSPYQFVQTVIDISSSDIVLNPGDSITLYYDFTFSYKADNRVMDASYILGADIVFEETADRYQITTEAVNGEIDKSVTNIVAGVSRVINFKANDGYVLDKVIVDGQEIAITAGMTSYEFTDIDSDHTISVEYKKQETGETNSGDIGQKDNDKQKNETKNNVVATNKQNKNTNVDNNVIIKTKLPFTGSTDGLLGLTILIAGIFGLLGYQKNSID